MWRQMPQAYAPPSCPLYPLRACSCVFSFVGGENSETNSVGYSTTGSGDASCTSITMQLADGTVGAGCAGATPIYRRNSNGILFNGVPDNCGGALVPTSLHIYPSEDVTIRAIELLG